MSSFSSTASKADNKFGSERRRSREVKRQRWNRSTLKKIRAVTVRMYLSWNSGADSKNSRPAKQGKHNSKTPQTTGKKKQRVRPHHQKTTKHHHPSHHDHHHFPREPTWVVFQQFFQKWIKIRGKDKSTVGSFDQSKKSIVSVVRLYFQCPKMDKHFLGH